MTSIGAELLRPEDVNHICSIRMNGYMELSMADVRTKRNSDNIAIFFYHNACPHTYMYVNYVHIKNHQT